MPRKKKDSDNTVEKVESNGTVEAEKKATPAKKPRTKKLAGSETDRVVEKKDRRPRKQKDGTVEKVEIELVKKGGVGGNGNLIPMDRRTKEEQREICTKAGVASGIARRRKKELREFTRDFLLQDAAPVLQNNMKVLGVDSEQMSNLAAMVLRLFNKAVNQGDLNSARTLIEWAGMAPLQQERENEAIARMSQVMQLASGDDSEPSEETDVVFYIPDNGRAIVTDEMVGVGEVVE